MSKIFDFVKPGVITGDDVQKVFQVAKENNFALTAVNCVGTDSINAVLEKLHRQGQDSLTSRERRILEEYSRRMQQKRR